jgi:hypothetical protein
MPGSLSPGIKRPVCEADHSTVISANVENGGVILALPISLHGLVFNSLNTGTTLPFIYRKVK